MEQRMMTDGWRVRDGAEIERARRRADLADLVGYHVGAAIRWGIILAAIVVGSMVIGGAA
jgi:hypothetical protein